MALRNERPLRVVSRHLILMILALLFIIPFYVILRNAMMLDKQIVSREWILWPVPMHFFQNMKEMFLDSEIQVVSGLKNSAIIAVLQTTFHILFASMAGYALARIPFKYRDLVFGFVIATMMIPIYVTFIPTYIVVMKLGLVNTISGIMLPAIFNTFSTFMFRQFFLDFPTELEEAGTLDGLGYIGIWVRIVMPNAVGISIALGIINFLRSWNAFLWPMVVGQDSSTWTIQVVLSQYITTQRIVLHNVFLGSFVALFPILILFFLLQKFIVQGVTLSGVKG